MPTGRKTPTQTQTEPAARPSSLFGGDPGRRGDEFPWNVSGGGVPLEFELFSKGLTFIKICV